MATEAEIKRALSELDEGQEVIVRMSDGSERAGRVTSTDSDNELQDTDREGIDLDNVDTILIGGELDGPE